MLTRVHQRLRQVIREFRHLADNWRDLHVVRPRADNMENVFHSVFFESVCLIFGESCESIHYAGGELRDEKPFVFALRISAKCRPDSPFQGEKFMLKAMLAMMLLLFCAAGAMSQTADEIIAKYIKTVGG